MKKTSDKSRVSALGVICIIVGILITGYAMMMDIGVNVDTSYVQQMYADNPNLVPNKIANTDLMGQRLCLLVISCTLIIIGTSLVLFAQSAELRVQQLLHIKVQTKILSLFAANAGVDAEFLNDAIKEAEEHQPLLFEYMEDKKIIEKLTRG